jgi:TatD DNase family protein
MLPPLVDSHCHLDFEDYAKDLPDVLARARRAGILAMICIGSGKDLATAERAVALAGREPDVFAGVGIHPHDVARMEDAWWPALEKLAAETRVVAVGETGLDYHYDLSPRDAQQQAFRRFLKMAGAVHKPFVVHVREAHDDAARILRAEMSPNATGVIHCFTGGVEDARRYLDMGLLLSFSGVLTFKNAEEIRRAAAYAPADRILIETDAPYLAPIPHRGKRNEPAFVAETLKVLAGVRGQSPASTAEVTCANAFRLFALPAPAGLLA